MPGGKRIGVLLSLSIAGKCLGQQTSEEQVRAAYIAGETALRESNLPEAEKAFREVLALAPNDVGARSNLGVIFMREKRWDAALEELTAAEKLAPQIAGIRLNIGLVYFRQQEYRRAIPPLESVVRDEPSQEQSRYLLGLCYLFGERYADAASVLKILWPTRNGDLNYLYVVSIAAGKADQHDLEEQALKRLLEVGKDSAELHLFLGKAHLAREENDQAFAELELAEQASPNLPFVHYSLGVLYRRRHDYERARREFLKDLAIEPEVAYDYDELGAVSEALDRKAEAKNYFMEAVKRDRHLATSYYGLAKIYKQQRQFAEALGALDSAGTIDPKSPSVHYLRAQILIETGKRTQAQMELAEVRRLQTAEAGRLEREVSGAAYRDPQLAVESK